MNLDELKAKLEAIDAEQRQIADAAEKAGNKLTDDQRKRLRELDDEFKSVSDQIKQAEADEALLKSVRGRSVGTGRRTAAANPNITVKEAWEDDPCRGFKTPRDFMLSVIEAGTRHAYSPQDVDPRLQSLRASGPGPIKHAAAGADEQSSFSDPYGGFLVPTGLLPGLKTLTPEADPIGALTMKVPMTQPRVEVQARVDKNHTNSVSGGLRVYRRAESDTGTSSRMEFEKIALQATNLFGIAYATEEILTDSPISFAALLSRGFSDEFVNKLIDERLNGTGVGEFEGINNSPALISVDKETGQAADTIVYENIIKMRSRCYGYAKAVWCANHDTIPQLMLLNQTVGTGGMPVWQPSAREDHPDILLGRPLYFTEYCETVGDAGDIVLANWGEYLEGTLQGVQSAESIHVRFENHERTFKFWMRNDGRGWWRSTLTPKQSTTTLSPFVRLAARA